MPKKIKRMGLRGGGMDASQDDFGGGNNNQNQGGSDDGFSNNTPSRVTEITIGDAPTVFDINKVGDPSQNPKSINVEGDDRFSGYTPSFATPPSFFDKAISKGKSFVKFASPFLVNAAFGTFVPSKVKKGIALFNLAKNIDTIQDMTTQDVLEEDVTLAPDGRTGFFRGAQADASAGRGSMSPGTSSTGGQRGGNTGKGRDRDFQQRGMSKADYAKSKQSQNFGGGRDGKATTKTKPKFNLKSTTKKFLDKQMNKLNKLANLDKIYDRNYQAFTKTGLPSDTGIISDARHLAGMNELSKSLSPFGGRVGEFIGDLGAFGLGLINEAPDFFRGANPAMLAAGLATKNPVTMRAGLDDKSVAAGLEDVKANLGVFSTPQTTTIDQIFASKGLKDGGQPKKIPIRSNKYGVKELDYRKSGGFVPIGVKEKADDVPAMLSKNEFVFTADAVRGAGNGSINKGAQKMYNLMKNLETRRV